MEKATQVRKSTTHGMGLFALRKFACGETIEPLHGEYVWRERKSKYAIPLHDGRSFSNCRFINAALHSQGKSQNVRIDLKKQSLVAVADVAAGDELLSEYPGCF